MRSSERNLGDDELVAVPAPVGASLKTDTAAGKLLALFDAFGPEQSDYSLAELSLRTTLPKSTCHRILRTLEEWGGVERSPAGRYRMGVKLFELGGLIPERLRLRELALPYMEDLLAATGEIVHLAKLSGRDVLYIERLSGHRCAPSPSRVGGRVPAHCTALGKVMLAFRPEAELHQFLSGPMRPLTPYTITTPAVFLDAIERVRQDGVAYDREEACLGLTCAAAPIFAAGGQAMAAISVSGASTRFRPESIAAAVKATSLTISRRLGWFVRPT